MKASDPHKLVGRPESALPAWLACSDLCLLEIFRVRMWAAKDQPSPYKPFARMTNRQVRVVDFASSNPNKFSQSGQSDAQIQAEQLAMSLYEASVEPHKLTAGS